MPRTPRPVTATPSTTVLRRMLAAVALAGAAALVAGCALGAETDPGSPPGQPAIMGADPVPLDPALLPGLDIFDGTEEQAIAVRWATPGESIAVIVGGSGTGGECIPQPHAAGLEPSAPSIVVRFDPPAQTVCTMDFRLHGFELALAEPIDASGIVPVRLVSTSGAEETIEVELGPDDLLGAGPTADPQPSVIPGDGEAAAPEPIPGAQLPDPSALGGEEIAVRWIEPGVSIAVMLGGSGTQACVPQPVGAATPQPGTIDVAFMPASGDTCTDDLVVYGWRFTLPEPVSATMPVEVRVAGASDGGATMTTTVEPEDVLELG